MTSNLSYKHTSVIAIKYLLPMDNIQDTMQSEQSLDCLRETELLKYTTPAFLFHVVEPTWKTHRHLFMFTRKYVSEN